MKKLLFYLTVSSLLQACDIKTAKINKQQPATAVSVVLDITDPRAYWPTADQLLQMYQAKVEPNAEWLFRLKTISDKRLTPIITYHLADAESMEKENSESDPQFRNKNIAAFYSTVGKSLKDFYSRTDTTQSLSNSECYRAIVDELRFLAENKSDRRILIVASDLREKSDLMDSYTASLINPKAQAEKLNRVYPVPENLVGVTVVFLFNPKDRTEDQTFSLLVEIYKSLLQSTGAEIKVQANL